MGPIDSRDPVAETEVKGELVRLGAAAAPVSEPDGADPVLPSPGRATISSQAIGVTAAKAVPGGATSRTVASPETEPPVTVGIALAASATAAQGVTSAPAATPPWAAPATMAPDDDTDFLRDLDRRLHSDDEGHTPGEDHTP